MSFIKLESLYFIIPVLLVFVLLHQRVEKKFFHWVYQTWSFQKNSVYFFARFFYYSAFVLFSIALLDLRGPEKTLKGSIPDQKTIILIDTSLSMLSEDVRPNRFLKAIQVARHFVKQTAGHQVSIVLFSDTQKRLLPFTDDLDLIDSRLAALETNNSLGGGTNISQAINECVGYFLAESGDVSELTGNILLMTDAEEGESKEKIKIPRGVNLAILGLGTISGSNIPLRYDDGSFKGYKTSGYNQVTTRLDEAYIKSIGKDVDSFKYWIVNSYNLPSLEINNFFKTQFKKSLNTGNVKAREAEFYIFLIPAFILYILSVLIGRLNFLKVSLILISILLLQENLVAQDDPVVKVDQKLKEQESQREILELMDKVKSGKANDRETLKLGELLMKNKKFSEALKVYSDYEKKIVTTEEKFNFATSLLASGQHKRAASFLNSFYSQEVDPTIKDRMRQNVLKSVKKAEQDEKQKKNQQDKEKNKDQDKDQNKDQNKQDQENKDQNDNGQGKNQQKKDQEKNDQQKNDQQKNDQQKNDQQKKDQEKNDEEKMKNEKKPQVENKNETDKMNREFQDLDEKEKSRKQKEKMVKLPSLVKQLMSDDRQLQKKMMDTSTKKMNLENKKDW